MNSKGGNKTISLSDFEALIQAGDFSAVAKTLRTMNMKQIPRTQLARYAHIANRAHQGIVAHRILQPVVRPEGKILLPPSDAEKLEYAEALRLMGVISEAVKVLSEINFSSMPIVDLRTAFCLMTQWQYAEAMPYLQRYIQNADPKEYSYTIAKVNLAACFVAEREDDDGLKLLELLIADTKSAGHNLLHGNCLGLAAQIFIRQGRFDQADQTLDEALRSFSDQRMKFSLYLRKWRAISRSLRMKSVHPDLYECRNLALREKDWETQRDCDLYIGFLRGDEELIHHVYFGTPYDSYRKRIVDLVGENFNPPPTYIWDPLKDGHTGGILDVLDGRMDGSNVSLETGQLMHRLLLLLCSDFYRPLSIGTAFSELFSHEQYSQQGSSNRIPQIVKRLRDWFKQNDGLFSIQEDKGSYRLHVNAPVGIRVQLESPELSLQLVTWKKVSTQVQDETFSRREVIQALNCSQASANRLLRWALKSGQAQAIGAGRQRKYRMAG